MIQNKRVCKIEGHQEFNITHLCTAIDCNKQSRWNCAQCIVKQIHRHNNLNFQEKIMSRQEILNELQQEIQGDSESDRRKIHINIDQILLNVQSLQQQLLTFKKTIDRSKQQADLCDNYKQLLSQILDDCRNENFYQLEDWKIDFIVRNQKPQEQVYDHQQLQEIQKIVDTIKLIETQIKNLQITNTSSIKNIQIEQREYQVQQIEQTEKILYGCQISNDEKYLAYGGVEQKLKIYDLQQQQQTHDIKLNGYCMCCQFTLDSKNLFVGVGGRVHQYDVVNDFKLIQDLRIHEDSVNCIIPLLQDQSIITCSSDKTIIKMNIMTKIVIFRLTGHSSYVMEIQYIDKDILISAGCDQSIILWDCNEKKALVDKQYAHQKHIIQLQLINNNKHLLSLCREGILKKWEIDAMKKILNKLQQFVDPNKIFNFYQVKNDQFLLIICEQYVKILNQEGIIVKQIQHHAGSNERNLECQQLDNLNLILIRSQNKIVLARALC